MFARAVEGQDNDGGLSRVVGQAYASEVGIEVGVGCGEDNVRAVTWGHLAGRHFGRSSWVPNVGDVRIRRFRSQGASNTRCLGV